MDMLRMRISTILAIALTISLILLGIVGLALSYFNPINWIPYTVPCIDYVGCWIQPTLIYLSSVIETLNTNWLITLPTSLALFAMGLLQPESRRNIRAFPRKVISTYRKVCVARDWVFAKIEYLNGESKKWRTAFNIVKSPFTLLRMAGFSPQMAITFLSIGSVAGGGLVVAEVTQGRSFANGDAGIYSAPLDAPVFADQEYNTLRLDLGTTSVGNITIENISLGTAYAGSALPSNAGGNVIYVGGIAASTDPTFNETYLEVGKLTIDRWRCARLDISNSEIHKLIVHGNLSDGQSISPVAGVPRDRGINGGNRADDMETKGGLYDMLKITSASSGVNGKVDVLKLSNIYARGGACVLNLIKAGTMEITLNEIGGDESLATKAFTIATSVVYKSFLNTSNIEVSMPLPASQ
jgi:hypothetical protein